MPTSNQDYWKLNTLICGSRKYPWQPHRRGQIFLGGGGINLPNFPVGRGVHHREILPEGSHDTKESDKEKTQKFTSTI